MTREHESHSVFDHTDFFPALIADMDRARALVVLHSPFFARNRIEIMRSAIERCIRRRVRVCVLAQEAKDGDTEAAKAKEHYALVLRSLGAHVTIRPGPHFKIVVVDEEIFWDGSLNMLSYKDTEERMTRWISRAKVIEATKRHRLDECSICRTRPSSVNDVLVMRRQYLGLSQRDLARRCGISHSVISRLEAGKDVKASTLSYVLAELKLDIRVAPVYVLPVIDDMVQHSTNRNYWFAREEVS